MEHILELAEKNQREAWEVIRKTAVMNIWKSVGAEINLVGSLNMGLLVKNRDVDFHIYSSPLTPAGSFMAMAKLAENPFVKRITYNNLLDTEEACIEWHAWYEDPENGAAGVVDGKPTKPDPYMVDEMLKELGSDKEHTLYVGDSQVDVQTAFNTGLDMVAVLWGFRDKEVLTEAGATRFIEQPSQLLHYL